MAHLDIKPAAVASVGSQVTAVASQPTPTTPAVTPPAQDPVSMAVAQTLSARVSAITGYTAAASAITETRGTMIKASSAGYEHEEAANAASLGRGGSAPGGAPPTMPTGAIPTLPAPTTPAPAIGAPPTSGKAIAELIHSGAGPDGLFAAAQTMHQHAEQLRAASGQLRGSAGSLTEQWDSSAGSQASSRIAELSAWYDTHAQHASAAAGAMEQQGESYGRARSSIPTPEQFADVERRLQVARTANQMPGSLGKYAPVITQLQIQLAELNSQAVQGYGTYSGNAADPSVVGDPLKAPPRPGGDVEALSFGPDEEDPPHGKDPRYWIDVTKIIHVPEGELAPYGTTQIGPGLYYPTGNPYSVSPPPPPAQYPLDASDIDYYPPGGPLPPYGSTELSPGYHTAPTPPPARRRSSRSTCATSFTSPGEHWPPGGTSNTCPNGSHRAHS